MRLYALALSLTTLLALVACSTPRDDPEDYTYFDEGTFEGATVELQVCGKTVTAVRVEGLLCQGTTGTGDACAGSFSFALPDSVSINEDRFSISGATYSLDGVFLTPSELRGDYSFEEPGCCTATGTWTAAHVGASTTCAPEDDTYSPPTGDTVDQQDTLSGSDTVDEDTQTDTIAPTDVSYGDWTAPDTATVEQLVALDQVNTIRVAVGVPPLAQSALVNQASQAHADYFLLHYEAYVGDTTQSVHEEVPEWSEGFTGVTFVDRLVAAGYTPQGGWEVMAFTADPVKAVEAWIETLYHRIPLIHPNAWEMGYGLAADGARKVDVMDVTSSLAMGEEVIVLYPYDGQTGIPTSWSGEELPQPPLPPGAAYPTGPVITATASFALAPSASDLLLVEHEITDDDGGPITHHALSPANDPHLGSSISLIPLSPLNQTTTYHVYVKVEVDGTPMEASGTFTTGQ